MPEETALNISKLSSELENYENERIWSALYMDLLVQQEQMDYTTHAALSKSNMLKNRYRDVLPSDEFRVRLNRQPDYINANRCVVPLQDLDICKSYIMAQGPMEETSGDFWEMVWQENCSNIVMLTNTIENRMRKCHQYFPDKDRKLAYHSAAGTFTIRLLEQHRSTAFVVRKLAVEFNEMSRNITHYHYRDWPDHGVPENPMSFLKFFLYLSSLNVLPAIPKQNSATSSGRSSSTPLPPPVLHCSAGIGRTGVLCVVDSCYSLLSKGCSVDMETITDVIMSLRRCRRGAVQTPEQLRFVSFAVCSVGQIISEKRVEDLIAEAVASLEPDGSIPSSTISLEIPAPSIEPTSSTEPTQPSGVKRQMPSTNASSEVPRRVKDPKFLEQESDSKIRRSNMLSRNWGFWTLTKLQAATGNRQGLAVVTLCVAAFAVGVGLWKKSS